MKTLKKNFSILSILAISMTVFPTNATAAESLMESVQFSPSQSQTQSRTVTLPANAVITDVKTDNGNVSYTKNGDKVNVTVSGGDIYSNVYNSKKYSRYETASRTSSTDSFAGSVAYNSGGYSGSLYQNGNSYISSGSYSPSDSYFVSGQTSSYYSSGGYSGYLSRYLYSYTPEKSRYISEYRGQFDSGYCDSRMGAGWTNCEAKLPHPSTISYQSDGYKGTLSYVRYQYWDNDPYPSGNGYYRFDWTRSWYYSGTIYLPGSDVSIYRYQGYVSKPASDTRRYTQNYAGYVYSAGYDTTYKYNVTITYEIDVLGIPRFIITHDENWTNGNVVVNVSVFSPRDNKIQNVRLPNGTTVTSTSFNYTVTENGLYTFVATDDTGAIGYGSADVTNIDRNTPALDMPVPSGWVKEDPTITIQEKK